MTSLYIHHCILLIYWSYLVSVIINSGILCARSKRPCFILLIVMKWSYCAIYYKAAQVLENALILTLFTVKADLVNCSQKNTIFLKSLNTH